MAEKELIQLKYNAPINSNLIDFIKNNYNIEFDYISNIGIQAPIGWTIKINEREFEIGDSKMLMLSDVQITSLKTMEKSNDYVTIDCILNTNGFD